MENDELAQAAYAFARAIIAASLRPAEPDRNLSVKELATRLGVSRSTVYNRMRRGEIESLKIGRRRLIPPDEVRRLMRR